MIPEMQMAWVIGIVLFLAILLPFLYYAQRRGKAQGHSPRTWWRPRGHTELGPDTGRGPGGRTTVR